MEEICPKRDLPLHVQAENILRKLIEEPEYKNGKVLPDEVTLSQQLGISRNTLRQAINKLVYEGLLVRKRRVGTKVVRKGLVSRMKNWLSFSQEMRLLGIEVRNYELHISYKEPTGEIAAFFGMGEGVRKPCLVLERVRGNTSYPFVYFISYFNPNILFKDDEVFQRPLYEILEHDYGITVNTSKEEIKARLAGADIAKKLNISSEDAILVRKRLVLDVNDVPIEYNLCYYESHSFSYTVESVR